MLEQRDVAVRQRPPVPGDAVGAGDVAPLVALEHDQPALGERVERTLLPLGNVHWKCPKGQDEAAPRQPAQGRTGLRSDAQASRRGL